MKAIALIFVLLVCGCRFDRILISSPSDDHVYNYFPLRTNYLEFSVKAERDIHIILTNQYAVKPPYYEIAIGAWYNTKSFLRKDKDEGAVEYHGAIVDKDVFQTFWVSINDTEESISVGKQHAKAFLHFKDPSYVKMSYFGIHTGHGIPGGISWNFDFDMFKCTDIQCF